MTDSKKEIKILIVDDEDSLRELLVEILETEDLTVLCCSDAAQALDFFKKNSYDLVITDFGLPKINGLQLAEKIKDINPATPIIMLTGWGSESEPFKDENHYVDFILTKPFDLNDLLKMIKKSLDR